MGQAKDFLRSIAETPSIEVNDRGSYTEELWTVRGASMRVIGNQIMLAHGSAEGLYVLLLALVKKLREHKPWKLKQLDQWLIDSEGTRAMHRALARAIEKGEIEEGGSRGDWNEFYIVYPELAEGQAKDFLKAMQQQTPDGRVQVALQGYGFKRVAGRGPEDPREIWQLRRGSVTHTVQRGGPGTVWFYRRNTVPDYNFSAGPRSMLQALPRYLREGAAKDFVRALRERPVYCRLFGGWAGKTPLYWSKRIRAWTTKDDAPLLRLDKLKDPLPEGTRAIEIVDEDGGLISTGAPLLGHWKRRYLPGYRGESVESGGQLDFDFPSTFKKGTAQRTLKALRARLRERGFKGEVIESGRRFRRLVGQCPCKGVYVWQSKQGTPNPWANAHLVVELSVSQGLGEYNSWFIQQNWASFSVLCHALRTWRNLQGASLYINGMPEGQVSYTNPRLVALG